MQAGFIVQLHQRSVPEHDMMLLQLLLMVGMGCSQKARQLQGDQAAIGA